jgi:hypothetical protein
MAAFAVQQIELAISLYTSVCQHHPKDRRYRRNLEWLEKLRVRLTTKVAAASTAKSKDAGNAQLHSITDNGDAVDEFLGWRTRLIERTGQDRPTISTIRSPATPAGSLATNNTQLTPNATYQNAILNQQISDFSATDLSERWPANDPINVAVSTFRLGIKTLLILTATRLLGSHAAAGPPGSIRPRKCN